MRIVSLSPSVDGVKRVVSTAPGMKVNRSIAVQVAYVLVLGAFILLALIGGKMLLDAFREGDEEDAGEPKDARLDFKELLMLAIATSIDALAVGITFAFLGVNIVWAIAVIGVTTFVLSVVGVAVGHAFGARYEKGATIAGSIVLILIGCKILFEHLGFIAL